MRHSDTGDVDPTTLGPGVPRVWTQARRPCPDFDAWEAQQIFREMVIAELLNGRLSARRRKRIVQYAAYLNIHPRLAGRLVAQARRIAAQRCPTPASTEDADTPPVLYLGTARRSPSRPIKRYWLAVVALLAIGLCVIAGHAVLP